MSLLTERTKWIFLLTSKDDPEERHIYDIAFGIACIESKGITPKSISIFIDCVNKTRTASLLGVASSYHYTFKPSADLFTELSTNDFDNIILFVTGHGSIEGLHGSPSIKPFPLFSAIKKAPGLKLAVAFFGQCYAGIFNYMSIGEKKDEKGNLIEPPIIVIGATNLFNSISSPTTENFHVGQKSWQANLFLLNLFRWIVKPLDIDGDDKYTVMDAYKFAGAFSNDNYKKIKSEAFSIPFKFINEIKAIDKELEKIPKKDPPDSKALALQLDKRAIIIKYRNSLDIQFNHQESWILNTIPSQDIEFC